MPSSDPSNISLVMDLVSARRHQIDSILDVGIGCGKYGMLFREYLDGHWNGRAFHDKSTWRIDITGVEIFRDYIVDEFHNYIYNSIYIGDIKRYVDVCERKYDLIMMGDIIEHFPMSEGIELLNKLKKLLTSVGMIIVSTPNFETNTSGYGPAPFGNVYERHHCRWTETQFLALHGFNVQVYTGKLLTVTLR